MLSLKPAENPSDINAYEIQIPGCKYHLFRLAQATTSGTKTDILPDDTCVVAPPYRGPGAFNDPQLIRRVQVSLATRFNTTLTTIRRFVAEQNVALYGKVRRLGAGDTVWASSLTPIAEDRRDASWVRVSSHLISNTS